MYLNCHYELGFFQCIKNPQGEKETDFVWVSIRVEQINSLIVGSKPQLALLGGSLKYHYY